ncbi:uncharacterized protein [Apostichopus japonicus]|uniref:uncharacterized protein n=1 Tax=Stichopus japonicus TaxID=307972 RepID=UPI003AB626D6
MSVSATTALLSMPSFAMTTSTAKSFSSSSSSMSVSSTAASLSVVILCNGYLNSQIFNVYIYSDNSSFGHYYFQLLVLWCLLLLDHMALYGFCGHFHRGGHFKETYLVD